MKKNVGTIDRVIRLVLGLAIILTGVLAQSWYGIFGLVFVGTAVAGYCPLYAVFGIKTCRT
jgi:hypothetical protein